MYNVNNWIKDYYNQKQKNIILKSKIKKTPIYFLCCLFLIINKNTNLNKISNQFPKKKLIIQTFLFKPYPKLFFLLKKK